MYKKKRKRIQVLKQKLKTYFVGAFLFLPQLLQPKFNEHNLREEAEAASVFQLMIMETAFVFLIFALFRVQRLSRRVFGSLGFKEKFLCSRKLGLERMKQREAKELWNGSAKIVVELIFLFLT